jgi:hypothetical protein
MNHKELELPSELGKEHIEKNEYYQGHEKWANSKASKLMEETIGRHTQTEEARGGMTALQLRQDAAKRYEEQKKLKEASKLMQEAVGRHTQTEEERRTQVRAGMTARQLRQDAAKRYEEKTKLKEASKAHCKEENQILKPAPKLVAPTSKEKLASSTRKKKKPTPAEDYETIADFKCQLDIDRERWAQKTALSLLYTVSGCA